MIDPFVLLAPILLLGVVALLRFVGCDVVLGLEPLLPLLENLRAVAGFGAKVTLSWDPAPGADSYKINRTGGPSPASFSTSATDFVDTSVTIGTTYSYTVYAFAGGDQTTTSNIVSAIPGPITFQQLAESPEAVVVASVATPAFNMHPGDLIVVWIYYDGAGGQTVSGVSDSLDQYVRAVPPQPGTGMFASFRQEIWYKNNATGGQNLAVTATFAPTLNARAAISAHEYSTVDPAATHETISSASGSGTIASSGSVPAATAKLIFGAAFFGGGGGTSPSGFMQRSTMNGNATEDKPFDAPGMAEATFPTDPPGTPLDWIAQMVAFR